MIPSAYRTLFQTRPVWENPRIHLLDDMWLLTVVAVLVATGVPWYANDFEVDVGLAGVGLLMLGAMHVALTLLGASAAVNRRWHHRFLTVLHVTGVLVLGFIWQHVGALQNPLFLLVFVLPVIGATFLSRWQPYVFAAASIAVVSAVAASEAPELRWYASTLFGSGPQLTSLLGHPSSTMASPSLTGFYAPSSYLLVLLEVFAVLLVACAVAAEYVGLIIERLNGYTLVARAEAQRGEELWATLVEQLPVPALLIEPATLAVVSMSASAVGFLGGEARSHEGRPLFEVMHCSYLDAVQALLEGTDGEASMIVIRVADALRLTRVRVLNVAHPGRRLALLTVEDLTDTFCLKAALDTSEYAALVVDSSGRVMVYNERAAGLFGVVRVGVAAADLLPPPDAGLAWWEPGLTGRRKMHMEIGTRVYQVTSSAVRFPGETEPFFSVSILPLPEKRRGDVPETGATTIINARSLR